MAPPALPRTERFEILHQLGAGGFGVVYAAYDKELDVRVALKALTAPDPATIYSFKREFRSLSDLSRRFPRRSS